MADDNQAQIVIDGDIGPFKRKLTEMRAAMAEASARGGEELSRLGGEGERLGKVMSAATGGVAAFGAALAGAALAQFLEKTIAVRAEMKDLSEATGATVEGVSALSEVSQIGGHDLGSVSQALQTMSRNMVSADDDGKRFALALRAIGLDASVLKTMKPEEAMLAIAEALQKYSDGMGKTAAVQAIFGKSGAQLIPFLNDLADRGNVVGHITAEQAEKADQLTKSYARLKLQISIASEGFASQLIPGIEDVIRATNRAIDRHGVWLGLLASIGFATMKVFGAEIDEVKRADKTANEAFTDLLEAKQRLAALQAREVPNHVVARRNHNNEIREAEEEVARLEVALKGAVELRNRLSAENAPGRPGKKGGQSDIDPTSFAGGSKGGDESAMSAMRAELDARKAAYAQQNEWREMSLAQELEFWQAKRAQAGVSAKDIAQIEGEEAKLRIAFAKQMQTEIARLAKEGNTERLAAAKQLEASEAASAQTARDEALLSLSERRLAAQGAFKEHKLSLEEYVALQRQYSAQELAIEMALIEAKKAAQAGVPEYDPQAAEKEAQQRVAARQQHITRLSQIDDQDRNERLRANQAFEQQIAQTSSTIMETAMNRTMTWRERMVSIYNQLARTFLAKLIYQPMSEWIATHARMLAVKLGFLSANDTAQTASSARTEATKAAEATSVVGANAAEAASGAAASASSIPYVGWILAGVAFASVLSMVLGAKSSIKSARGGYDIPRGLNPLVQTHEEEMILPQSPANTLRKLSAMADAGLLGGGGGGGNVTYNDHSGRLTPSEIRRNARTIADELSRLAKSGYSV